MIGVILCSASQKAARIRRGLSEESGGRVIGRTRRGASMKYWVRRERWAAPNLVGRGSRAAQRFRGAIDFF